MAVHGSALSIHTGVGEGSEVEVEMGGKIATGAGIGEELEMGVQAELEVEMGVQVEPHRDENKREAEGGGGDVIAGGEVLQ